MNIISFLPVYKMLRNKPRKNRRPGNIRNDHFSDKLTVKFLFDNRSSDQFSLHSGLSLSICPETLRI